MKATVIKAFSGRPDTAPLPRMIAVGEEIDGELAEVAVREGWAEAHAEDDTVAPIDDKPAPRARKPKAKGA